MAANPKSSSRSMGDRGVGSVRTPSGGIDGGPAFRLLRVSMTSHPGGATCFTGVTFNPAELLKRKPKVKA